LLAKNKQNYGNFSGMGHTSNAISKNVESKIKKAGLLLLTFYFLIGCADRPESNEKKVAMDNKYETRGSVEILDNSLLSILDSTARIEVLASGFKWSEGPLWIREGSYLLFSDIPPNKIMKWSEEKGLEEYLYPSGYTGSEQREGEPGANGLILDSARRLVMCQHGDRRMARMNAPLATPKADFVTLADKYEGKKFNSPNDAVYHSSGELYFTDPPYGLAGNVDDPKKELPYQGVFRLKKDGSVDLLYKDLSRPNGIAFSGDEKKLFVANSDANKIWMVFDVRADGGVENGRIFFDASSYTEPGGPDGMKVHSSGIIFATGPGGIMVFSPDAKLIGRISTGDLCSNVAFDDDEKFLYVTSNHDLVRVHLK
jgi:gluconolactonase